MGRLKELRTGPPTLKARVPSLTLVAGATARLRGSQWVKLRKQALDQHQHCCADCFDLGIAKPAVEVDHIVPLEDGGTDSLDNLRPLCKQHHEAKTKREAIDRAYRRRQQDITR